MVAVDGFARVRAGRSCSSRRCSRCCSSAGYLKREGLERPEYLALMLLFGDRHDAHGDGERPRHRVPVARDPVDRALRARRVRPQAPRRRRRPASSTSCSVRSPLRSSSTASRSPTARPERRTSPGIAAFLATTTLLHDGVLLARNRASCSSGSASRSPPRRSTCGRPTSTRARPRRSPRSWPRDEGRCVRRDPAHLRRRVPAVQRRLAPGVFGLAVLSLLVGSIAAVVQTDVKRMLAYSSISHAGFILIGGAGRDRQGHERGALLPAHVRVHGDRRVRGRRWSSPAAATTATHLDDYRGLAARAAGARGIADPLPARASRRAAHRRFRRQARGLQRGGRRGQYWLALIGMLAAVDRRVRLPAHRPRDVRTRRRRGPRRTLADPRRLAAPASRSRSPRSASVLFLGVVPGVVLDFAQRHAPATAFR